MVNKRVRPVNLEGINIMEIQQWLQSNRLDRKGLICQSIIALHNGASMNEVCKVLSVTRETVRLWKLQLRDGGLSELLKDKKVGKRSKLNEQRRKSLVNVLKKSPGKYGFEEMKWSGKLIQQYVKEKWNYNVCLRTAQLWMANSK
jgi:transposase